jgi:hypothetical protein
MPSSASVPKSIVTIQVDISMPTVLTENKQELTKYIIGSLKSGLATIQPYHLFTSDPTIRFKNTIVGDPVIVEVRPSPESYQVGQLVETVLGVGTIKEIRGMYKNPLVFLVAIGKSCDVFDPEEISPYIPPNSHGPQNP